MNVLHIPKLLHFVELLEPDLGGENELSDFPEGSQSRYTLYLLFDCYNTKYGLVWLVIENEYFGIFWNCPMLKEPFLGGENEPSGFPAIAF